MLTTYGLAQLMGIDSHIVTRWIRTGLLRAKCRGTRRTPQQGGDSYAIRPADVRHRSPCTSPLDLSPGITLFSATGGAPPVDIRKADQLWLLDLITNGLVCSP